MDSTDSNFVQIQVLLDRLRTGDASARDHLINHSCDCVGRLARKMLRGYPGLRRWEQTDDVLQDSMLRLHRSLAHVRPESVRQFYGLAATEIRRTLIDLARHHHGHAPPGTGGKRRGSAVGTDSPLLRAQAGRENEPETLAAWTHFHEVVESLPDEEREVFNLLWYAAVSQVDAAAILGVTERTVRRRWASARCCLYDALDGESPE